MEDRKMKLKASRRNVFIVNEAATLFAKSLLAMFLGDKFEAVKQNSGNGDNVLDIKKKRRIHAPEIKHRRTKREMEEARCQAVQSGISRLCRGDTQPLSE